jgi:hypothetical protein
METNISDAFAQHEAQYKTRVMHATWGHLAPEPLKEYPGHMLFAWGQYGDIVIVDSDFGDLPGSPWRYSAEHDFAGKTTKIKERGGLYKFTGKLRMCRNGVIKFIGKTVRVRP